MAFVFKLQSGYVITFVALKIDRNCFHLLLFFSFYITAPGGSGWIISVGFGLLDNSFTTSRNSDSGVDGRPELQLSRWDSFFSVPAVLFSYYHLCYYYYYSNYY